MADEFEVEAIHGAKVVRKQKKQFWEYDVKWKGYPVSQNTWEPIGSFVGSEGLVDSFWAKLDLDGRDYQNMTQFTVGEIFTPTPARRGRPKLKGKGESASTSNSARETKANKRRRDSPEIAEPSSSERKPTKRGRVESIEESASAPVARSSGPRTPRGPPKLTQSISTRSTRRKPVRSPSPNDEVPPSPSAASEGERPPIDADDEPTVVEEEDVPMPPVPKTEKKEKAPSHKTRAANPLVKMVDDFATMDNGIAAKRVKAIDKSGPTAGPSNGSQTPRRSERKGRSSAATAPNVPSSILRAEKGNLKTVQRTQQPTDQPEEIDNLHELSGIDPKAADGLDDFEEDVPPPSPEVTLQQNIAAAKNSLFPSSSTVPHPTPPTNWRRSTIFGPLGFGSSMVPSSSCDSKTFSLKLDTNIVLPVTLLNPSESFPSQDGQPITGQFFNPRNAQKLLDTVRTGNSSARAELGSNATPEQAAHFQRFQSRLAEGEMFTMMVGSQFMAFGSSEALVPRLNLPAALLAFSSSIYLSELVIENDVAYVEVIESASKW
ncbi:Chromo domain-containing protein [Mycena indigotica]|uniref:Chromo domain-containing protein n=1 Tax=Mycena indigotica TaxID=2126181 RepID=A0A8H6VUX8_9AGAR|nr:Chromo domain-containing protein [Mycena indigotica]KAF7294842.1 Chromo domain-containing protein [Mycena indigotica]